MLPLPIFITNFKNYEQATGARALELALVHERVAKDTGVSIGVCVSATDIFRVASEVSIPVFSQHVDPIDYGKFTGHVLPQGVKRAGAFGTLLNHSERRLENDVLKNSVSCAQKASLMRIVCAESVEEVEGFAGFGPDFLAFEPPELIGSTTASVASESPRSIADCVAVSRDIPVLVGAGINSARDVEVSLGLGARGFLVATAVVKASDPEGKLRELVGVKI